MRSHIDWLTFTMRMEYSEGENEAYATAIERAFMATFDSEVVGRVFGGQWITRERGRAPYADAWELRESGLVLFASPTLLHACVEISGSGCERLIKIGMMEKVLAAVRERVTRIDIACDIETDVKPQAFVEQTTHKRMRANGYQNSATGETCYVGSQKSDRYARVYRYAEPHPRSHLLRVEHVFRREYAKVVSAAILENGISSVAEGARNAFGWAHPCWGGDESIPTQLSLVSESRSANNTIFWLVNQVAPAIKRLIQNGEIKDPEVFFTRYFLPQ